MSLQMNIAKATGAPTIMPTATVIHAASTAMTHKATPAVAPTSPTSTDPMQMARELEEAVQKINDEMKKNGRELDFSMDKVLDCPVVTVKNSATGEVIRQIPNETTLRVAHNLADLKGLLLNKSA